jgi:CHAT domain-containing protein
VYPLPAAAQIEDLVDALTVPSTLADAEAARELGAELYRTVLAPAEKAIAGKALVIVPSRKLGYLPFELLVEPGEDGSDHWLVAGHRIRYTPSLTSLHFVDLWDCDRTRPDRLVWQVGDPDYGIPATDADSAPVLADARETLTRGYRGDASRGAIFERLPGSRAEVEAIRAALGASNGGSLLGREATEGAVKGLSDSGELAHYRYVHFACHGILGQGDGLQPALVLARPVPDAKDDGFLQLDEVTGLRLNADLVVLSACQTGQGRLHNAEGVSGLARGFLYAGSRAVLCSLWRVDDLGTAEPQLRLIAAGEPPSAWAAFILIGQDRPAPRP